MKKLLLAGLVGCVSTITAYSATDINIKEVTKNWTYKGLAISAFPGADKKIPHEENYDIRDVFHYYAPGMSNLARIEVICTGGDWMKYGMVYFVTDAPSAANPYGDPKAYFIESLSTADKENGSKAPKFNPLNKQELESYILNHFLDAGGRIKPGFKSL